jgi:thiol-disulfide isomerase/thioredoxin
MMRKVSMRISLLSVMAVAAAVAVCATALVASADSEARKGKLGDPAPALQVAEWIKGAPVNLADGKGKNVYVIELWATWCGPCRASIPHLTELQHKYKDKNVTIISVSIEDAKDVKPFVEQKGADMGYTVAVDSDTKTYNDYMKPFGQDGIPHAFVVDKDGKIAWHGHPLDGLDEALNRVLAKKTDDKKPQA